MKLLLAKSKWEMEKASLREFLDRVAADGFEASEIYLRCLAESSSACRDLHAERGLDLIAQITTEGSTVDDHLHSLERNLNHAISFAPLKINAHAGRDIFSFEENLRIFEAGIALSEAAGVPLCFETHRFRALFALSVAKQFAMALPKLRITADFSHFTVVHESDLSDQIESLRLLMSRTGHVHARVGHEEGPQVPDPRAPEWHAHTARFESWWKEIHALARARGDELFTITPEFGPVTYMPTIPFLNKPVSDAWEINVWLRERLLDLLKIQLEA